MEEIKTWKEATKLTRLQILRISINIPVAIICITTAIFNGNIAWGMCGLLWILIGFIEGISYKIQNRDDYLIEMLKKDNEINRIIIAKLLPKSEIEIKTEKIKIPDNFSKPNPNKMKHKFAYYRKNHKFESQIIIDPNYNLLDGYTSYLIAKECNRPSVIVKIRRISE